MLRAQYVLTEPWPEVLTLNQLLATESLPVSFSEIELLHHVGQPGKIPAQWTELVDDYYTTCIQFCTVEVIEQRVISSFGPFQFLSTLGDFALLTDNIGTTFSHPKLMKVTIEERELYRSSAVKLWSGQKRMKQLARAKKQKSKETRQGRPSRAGPVKQIEASVTIGQVAADVDVTVFDKLALYIEAEADMGMIAFERDDTNLQLHVQGVMSIKTTSIKALKQRISGAIGCTEEPPVGASICIKFVKSFRKYRASNPLSIGFRGCIREMVQSGQYLPALRWLLVPKISCIRAERLWRMAVTPTESTMEDVEHVFFGNQPSKRCWNCVNPNEMKLYDNRVKREQEEKNAANEQRAKEAAAEQPLELELHATTPGDL
ncbi:hypothetical protein R1sor_006850 [Riccia sorocarpa]|uniref:Uncharacterized protein n=1 Tax=Riccia sorocarpa TaxID=122646 RepID=A0ABD3HV14_9MARC